MSPPFTARSAHASSGAASPRSSSIASGPHWLLAGRSGLGRVLGKADRESAAALVSILRAAVAGRPSLVVGDSTGGILARLLAHKRPLAGARFWTAGRDRRDRDLGSPQRSRRRRTSRYHRRARRAPGRSSFARRIAGSRGRMRERRLACDRRTPQRRRPRARRRRRLSAFFPRRAGADRRRRPGPARLDAPRGARQVVLDEIATARVPASRGTAGTRPSSDGGPSPSSRGREALRARTTARGDARRRSQRAQNRRPTRRVPVRRSRIGRRAAGPPFLRRIVGSRRWPAAAGVAGGRVSSGRAAGPADRGRGRLTATPDGLASRARVSGTARFATSALLAREDRRAAIGEYDRRAEQRDEHRERPGSGDGPNAAQGLQGRTPSRGAAGRLVHVLVGATRVSRCYAPVDAKVKYYSTSRELVHEAPEGTLEPGAGRSEPGPVGACTAGARTRSSRGTSAR